MTTSNESCAHRLAATPELIGKRSLWAYVAALWAFAFAVLHIAWAAGFYLGLQEGPARAAFQRTWFLAYDITAAALCLLGGALALWRARPAWRSSSATSIDIIFSFGAGVLALRAIAGALQVTFAILTGHDVPGRTMLWEMWFCVGAFLFGMNAFGFKPSEDPSRQTL